MKRYTGVEIGGLIIAAAMFVIGLVWVAWPVEQVFVYGPEALVSVAANAINVTSKLGSQIYGAMAMLVGVGMAALALYRPKT
jgi:hypothetical protein